MKTSLNNLLKITEFEILDIKTEHIFKLHKLPHHHKDPFDRLIIAQALTEGATIITSDSKIKRYRVSMIG